MIQGQAMRFRRPAALISLFCCLSGSLASADIGDFLWKLKRSADRVAACVGTAQNCSYVNDTAYMYIYENDYAALEGILPLAGGDTARGQEDKITLSDITIEPLPKGNGILLLSMRFSDNRGNELPQKRFVSMQTASPPSARTAILFQQGDPRPRAEHRRAARQSRRVAAFAEAEEETPRRPIEPDEGSASDPAAAVRAEASNVSRNAFFPSDTQGRAGAHEAATNYVPINLSPGSGCAATTFQPNNIFLNANSQIVTDDHPAPFLPFFIGK